VRIGAAASSSAPALRTGASPRCVIAAALVLAVLGTVSIPRPVRATTVEGSLLTNLASMTLSSAERTVWDVTYCATARVLVVVPVIQLQKRASAPTSCSGETVTFCIYAVNTSPYTSAFNISLDDVLSTMMVYVGASGTTNTWTAGSTVAKGRGRSDFPPVFDWANEPSDGQGAPYSVRWLINYIGPSKSAMMCFQMKVL